MSNHEYVTNEFHEQLKRSQLSGNEVLVTIAGTIGRAGVNLSIEGRRLVAQLKRGNINQAIAIIRLNNKMLPLFLSAFLNSDGGQIQFSKFRHDFGTPNINTTELADIRIPLPPKIIQKMIVSKIIDFEKQILKAKVKCKKNEKKKSEIIT